MRDKCQPAFLKHFRNRTFTKQFIRMFFYLYFWVIFYMCKCQFMKKYFQMLHVYLRYAILWNGKVIVFVFLNMSWTFDCQAPCLFLLTSSGCPRLIRLWIRPIMTSWHVVRTSHLKYKCFLSLGHWADYKLGTILARAYPPKTLTSTSWWFVCSLGSMKAVVIR